MKRFLVRLYVVMTLVTGVQALGQGTQASLTGNVLDPSNAVIANAVVTALNTRTGVSSSTTTNTAGIYLFPSIQPGPYRLTVESPGFQTYVLNDVNVEIGARLNINFSLVVGGTTSDVQVTAAADPLLSTSPSVAGVIDDQRVRDLPLPLRDALGLVLTQPGISGDSLSGSRASAVNVTRDGVSVKDQLVNLCLLYTSPSPRDS